MNELKKIILRIYYRYKRTKRKIRGKVVIFFSNCPNRKNINIEKINNITPEYIQLGDNIYIGQNARIQGLSGWLGKTYSPKIRILDNVTIEQNFHLTCANEITIGEGTAIAANVTITDISHQYKDISKSIDNQPIVCDSVIIGSDCKIYNNAVILPGTVLGKHCIVGANSVVKGNFPPYSIIVGSPAKIKKIYSKNENEWIRYSSIQK